MVPRELVVHVGQVVAVRVDELIPLQVGHLDHFAFDLVECRQRKVAYHRGDGYWRRIWNNVV